MKKSEKVLYAVYDKDDILYSGTASEIADRFKCKRNSVYCNLVRKQKFKGKYLLVKVGTIDED